MCKTVVRSALPFFFFFFFFFFCLFVCCLNSQLFSKSLSSMNYGTILDDILEVDVRLHKVREMLPGFDSGRTQNLGLEVSVCLQFCVHLQSLLLLVGCRKSQEYGGVPTGRDLLR